MPQSLSPARPRAVRSVLVALATTATLAVTGLNGATAAAAEQPSSETAGQVVRKADRKNDQLERKHKKHARSALVSIRAFRVAAAQKGDPYRYGAAGPDAFDCSGLTSYAFRRAGKAIPRTSSAQRAGMGRAGDLVFFHGGGGVSHVGFYAGGHRILHSPYPGSSVKIERIWSRSVSYGRIG